MPIYSMARRKFRPLVVMAIVGVFLLFQLFRGGGREVFTFDSLPPYTDNENYVKKPVPPTIPWTEPPPPPPEWGQSRNPQGKHQYKPIERPDFLEPQQAPRPQRPGRENSHEDSNRAKEGNRDRLLVVDLPRANSDSPGHLADPPRAGFGQNPQHPPTRQGLDQPPTSGDYNTDRGSVYTPEELAPRVEKYPIPASQIMKLPKMKPNTLPKIQARIPSESSEQRRLRQQRQAAIKRAMSRSWDAYSSLAMGHDELRPISGRYYDPFCGWGATLIDSL